MTTKTFLAFDVETTGPDVLRHRVNGIGACLMSVQMDTGAISVLGVMESGLPAQFPRDYDPLSIANFWSHHQQARLYLENLTPKSNKAAAVALTAFNRFVASCYTKYPDLRIISDNPGFDASRIAVEFSRHQIGLPLEHVRQLDKKGNVVYQTNGRSVYRRILSSNDVLVGFVSAGSGRKYQDWFEVALNLKLKNPYVHNHTPLSDAKSIAWNYCTLHYHAHKQRTQVNRLSF